jgi:hypothetical protein
MAEPLTVEGITDKPSGFLSDLPSGNAEILMNQQPYDRSTYPQPMPNQLEPVPENKSPWPMITLLQQRVKVIMGHCLRLVNRREKHKSTTNSLVC